MKSVIFLIFIILPFISFLTLEAKVTKGFLTEDEISLFYKQGYLLKKKGLNSNDVAQIDIQVSNIIERTFEEILKSNDQSLFEKDRALFIDGSKVIFKHQLDKKISIARINGICGMEPTLLNLLSSEKMVHTFFELLNTSDIEHLISQFHPKLPGDGIAFPKHRDIQFRKSFDPDWEDILGNGSYAVCIIPVDPMNQNNGGLWIDRNNYPEPQDLDEDLIWVEADPGDLLFMHPYLSHGSGPNLSNVSRRTLLTGFCAFGANHKSYPGALVNRHLHLNQDGSIDIQPSPWSDIPSLLEGNH